jgi:hypothetical protein
MNIPPLYLHYFTNPKKTINQQNNPTKRITTLLKCLFSAGENSERGIRVFNHLQFATEQRDKPLDAAYNRRDFSQRWNVQSEILHQ